MLTFLRLLVMWTGTDGPDTVVGLVQDGGDPLVGIVTDGGGPL